jgi:hypothetical protein
MPIMITKFKVLIIDYNKTVELYRNLSSLNSNVMNIKFRMSLCFSEFYCFSLL